MNKKFKIILSAFPLFFVLFTLAGCSNNDSKEVKSTSDSQNSQDNGAINQLVAEKKLTIAENKCSGCGKCTRLDPTHFIFDQSSRKATVISSDNLDSQNLTMAISICRENAINII